MVLDLRDGLGDDYESDYESDQGECDELAAFLQSVLVCIRLAPLLARVTSLSIQTSSRKQVPARWLHAVLGRCTRLELLEWGVGHHESLTFAGQGPTPAQRCAGLQQQLAAMTPCAPLLNPPSWAYHNTLTAAHFHPDWSREPPIRPHLLPALAAPTLTSLSLPRNLAPATLPHLTALTALPLLTHLSVPACHLPALLPHGPLAHAIPALASLCELNIQYSPAPPPIPPHDAEAMLASWAALPALTALTLAHIPWDGCGHLPHLRKLCASNSAGQLSHLLHLTRLTRLELQWGRGAAVRGSGGWLTPETLPGSWCSGLQVLQLPRAVTVAPAGLQRLTALVELSLEAPKVCPNFCRALAALPLLHTLQLSSATHGSPLQPPAAPRPPLPSLRSLSACPATLNVLATCTAAPPAPPPSLRQRTPPFSWAPEGPRPASLGLFSHWAPTWLQAILRSPPTTTPLHLLLLTPQDITAFAAAAVTVQDPPQHQSEACTPWPPDRHANHAIVTIQVCEAAASQQPQALQQLLVAACRLFVDVRLEGRPLLAAPDEAQEFLQDIREQDYYRTYADHSQRRSAYGTPFWHVLDCGGPVEALPMLRPAAEHLLPLRLGGLPTLTSVNLDCGALGEGAVVVAALRVLAGAAPGLRQAVLRGVRASGDAVLLHVLAGNCPGLCAVAVGTQGGYPACSPLGVLEALSELMGSLVALQVVGEGWAGAREAGRYWDMLGGQVGADWRREAMAPCVRDLPSAAPVPFAVRRRRADST